MYKNTSFTLLVCDLYLCWPISSSGWKIIPTLKKEIGLHMSIWNGNCNACAHILPIADLSQDLNQHKGFS